MQIKHVSLFVSLNFFRFFVDFGLGCLGVFAMLQEFGEVRVEVEDPRKA